MTTNNDKPDIILLGSYGRKEITKSLCATIRNVSKDSKTRGFTGLL